ncbi:RNA-binding RNA processing protein rpp1 [Dimargaris verticillata]|uniref:RNA-binding RNA processing protein rpp1 n=1 Tax=Dimargaris verticillata TaxID=2761393 RepID=A0A9W8AYA1_9FUNG|nr:RNA-binding RNA processing protein rpp1 [Dimargaris verticillata]
MIFCDLNIPYPIVEPKATPVGNVAREQLTDVITKCFDLGYQLVALNQTIVDAPSKAKPVVIRPCPVVSSTHGNVTRGQNDVSATRQSGLAFAKRVTDTKSIYQLKRLTVITSDARVNYELSNPTEITKEYDILAVQPTTEDTFRLACGTYNIDLIALDLSKKLPFYFKMNSVNQAIERGIYFEICYSAAMKDNVSRRNLISNAMSLCRATRGRNIIISSEARRPLEVRSPYDIVNLGTLFSLNQDRAKHALTTCPRAVLYRCETRLFAFRSAILTDTDVTANPRKRKPDQGPSEPMSLKKARDA